VFQRGCLKIALTVVAVAAAVSCLALSLTSADTSQAAAQRTGSLASVSTFAGCEQALARAQQALARAGRLRRPAVPVLVIVGASFTAGVGAGNPYRSWAVLLARRLHWDAVIIGVPGAGYVRAGVDGGGPVTAELARADLSSVAPALVIVQAGHDDIGAPARLEEQQVARVVRLIRAQAPKARIALLTVFAGHAPATAARRTDQAIVTAGRAADRRLIIMDPLTGLWTFPRVADGLHPTAAGSEWQAATEVDALR
jgi:lysophospholipase L1-like esterase